MMVLPDSAAPQPAPCLVRLWMKIGAGAVIIEPAFLFHTQWKIEKASAARRLYKPETARANDCNFRFPDYYCSNFVKCQPTVAIFGK